MQSVQHTLRLLILSPQGKAYSHSSPALVWSLSHSRQSSMTFSSVGPSNSLQFQHEFLPQGAVLREQSAPIWGPTESQILSANLLNSFLYSSIDLVTTLLLYGLLRGTQTPLGIQQF